MQSRKIVQNRFDLTELCSILKLEGKLERVGLWCGRSTIAKQKGVLEETDTLFFVMSVEREKGKGVGANDNDESVVKIRIERTLIRSKRQILDAFGMQGLAWGQWSLGEGDRVIHPPMHEGERYPCSITGIIVDWEDQ